MPEAHTQANKQAHTHTCMHAVEVYTWAAVLAYMYTHKYMHACVHLLVSNEYSVFGIG